MGTMQRQRRMEHELNQHPRPNVLRSLRGQWPVSDADVREIERVFAGSVKLPRMLYMAGRHLEHHRPAT
mgnify:CR=1 FL=1